ncbi:MAG TPA: RNA polymerase sigma factor [Terriglobales bacterium]|jgi:RNA polymerase sigma-70 factor (ECF subfamily)|nr:RNA polymerase sigma factor [Terriglobales bacterium]
MYTAAAHAVEWTLRENVEIARGLRRRDPELLDRLIERFQHRLLRYLVFLTGNRELAEDIFQETWIRVMERGKQYNGKSKFDTWLFAIARHLVIDWSRKKTTTSLEALQEQYGNEHAFDVPASGPSPFDAVTSRENRESVQAALTQLDSLHREVLVLRFHEELSLEEIAMVTGAPLSTVKSRLYRGLAALKPSFSEAQL